MHVWVSHAVSCTLVCLQHEYNVETFICDSVTYDMYCISVYRYVSIHIDTYVSSVSIGFCPLHQLLLPAFSYLPSDVAHRSGEGVGNRNMTRDGMSPTRTANGKRENIRKLNHKRTE